MAQVKSKNKKLPAWDLTDLYKSIHDPKIKKDLEKYKKLNIDFAKKYKGKLAKLSVKDFAKAIKDIEEKSTLARLIGNFANLNMSTQMNNKEATAFYQNISEKLNDFSKPSIFFSLELNKLSDEKIKTLLKDKDINKYKPFIERTRQFKPYELSEEVEEVLQEKSVTSFDAWSRLYNEVCAKEKYKIKGKEYNDAEISQFLLGKDAALRKEAGLEVNRVKTKDGDLFAYIYNMIVKDCAIEEDKRGFKSPVSSMNLYNRVEDKTVVALSDSVRENYKKTAHRFYKLKAKWMGLKKLENWDRNAPLPFSDDSNYSWEEAVKIVLDSYRAFSPELHKIAKNFFENSWIDVPPRDGKRAGAFAAPVSAKHHPYLFLNFTGKKNDILTLAHELGHGCHMILSKKQGELNDSTPLVLAEVASVFGEMLTFQSLLKKTKDDKQRLSLIASKVNDMLNTAIRQIAYHFFETRIHDERKKGELSKERICKIWVEEISASLGDSVNIDEKSQYGWAVVGHFFSVPFYVYAYSFADCLVNSLYRVYQDKSVSGFEEKYLHLLSETGIKKYDELLKSFKLDANKKDFWNKGVKLISDYIDELERLDKKLKL